MALLFGPFATAPARSGNWTALPTLPAGVDPMREVVMSSGGNFYVGHCTAAQATDNAGFVFTSEAYVFIHTYARTDFGPEGS